MSNMFGRAEEVFGAGLAGLAAARRLKALGYDVIVLEGRDRIGGRIHTSNQWSDFPLDLGPHAVGYSGPDKLFAAGFRVVIDLLATGLGTVRTSEEKAWNQRFSYGLTTMASPGARALKCFRLSVRSFLH